MHGKSGEKAGELTRTKNEKIKSNKTSNIMSPNISTSTSNAAMSINDKKFFKPNFIVLEILAEREIQQNLIDKLQTELKTLPEGGLCRKIINGKTYLYHYKRTKTGTNPVIQKCISKDEVKLASLLKRRHFIQKSLPILQKNIKAIDALLKSYIPFEASEISNSLPDAYENLPKECYQDIGGKYYLSEWMKEDYKKCEFHPEGLIHQTSLGIFVRSKSEAIIVELLAFLKYRLGMRQNS